MIRATRCIPGHFRRLCTHEQSLSNIYGSLLKEAPFKGFVVKKNLDKEVTPYDFSAFILEGLADKGDLDLNRNLIHNRLIESLTAHDFAVGSINARELRRVGGKLSSKSFIEIIRSNPGRVQSSWEILIDNWGVAVKSQEALIAVFEKLLMFDSADIADGKTDLTRGDITKCIFLASLIGNKNVIKETQWETLLRACIYTRTSILIPFILSNYKPSATLLKEDNLKITKYQTYQIFHRDPDALFNEDVESFKKVLSMLGQNNMIELTDEELEVAQQVQADLKHMSQISRKSFLIPPPEKLVSDSAFDDYLAVIENSTSSSVAVNELREIAIRSLGIYRGDMSKAKCFFEKVETSKAKFNYAMFLVHAFNSVKKANKKLLIDVENLAPKDCSPGLSLSVKRGLVAAYSRFDLEKSLEIFNSTIQTLNKKPLENSFMSEAALLTEALIVAFLGNKDRDFAQVILEKATEEQVFPSASAVQHVKKHFATYGSMLDEPDLEQNLQRIILDYIKSL
ncbi:LAME_0C02586g1_1 [Lachancea meyersii CBS 8951]|uniref:LAME_0C02586g1_1 n=1 Tax=Lachancea meyersii CBS 8951 TaxID=1266667 RepID=A0A1G4IZL2_9SACH|nr:LAME_0C02586g1_1 [Lachancea meyersii CBS 8951]